MNESYFVGRRHFAFASHSSSPFVRGVCVSCAMTFWRAFCHRTTITPLPPTNFGEDLYIPYYFCFHSTAMIMKQRLSMFLAAIAMLFASSHRTAVGAFSVVPSQVTRCSSPSAHTSPRWQLRGEKINELVPAINTERGEEVLFNVSAEGFRKLKDSS